LRIIEYRISLGDFLKAFLGAGLLVAIGDSILAPAGGKHP